MASVNQLCYVYNIVYMPNDHDWVRTLSIIEFITTFEQKQFIHQKKQRLQQKKQRLQQKKQRLQQKKQQKKQHKKQHSTKSTHYKRNSPNTLRRGNKINKMCVKK